MRLLSDDINGPHFILEDAHPASEATLMVRRRYVGPGKVALIVKSGRKTTEFTVDAADLVAAILKLVPEAEKV